MMLEYQRVMRSLGISTSSNQDTYAVDRMQVLFLTESAIYIYYRTSIYIMYIISFGVMNVFRNGVRSEKQSVLFCYRVFGKATW